MAGGKKQKVTGFTQAEQELLAVSVEKYSMDEKSKNLRSISGILVNFKSEKEWNFKNYFDFLGL